MAKYHSIKVKSVTPETGDAVVIDFEIPEELKEVFSFEAGQYLGVKQMIDNEDVRRSYSICSAPGNGHLQIGVKKVPGGRFSTFANELLSVGQALEVLPPQGKFTHKCDPEKRGLYVFFAAGSGITPVISLIRDILKNEPQSEVMLFYGNRNSDSIMFREELEGLKNTYLTRFGLHFIMSREKQSADFYNGRINSDKCALFSRVFFDTANVDRFFICGPEPMINDVRDWLEAQSVAPDKVAFELFTSPNSRPFVERSTEQKQDFDPSSESMVTVRIDGDTTEFKLAYGDKKNILDAAIQAGADAPFSCKGGVCCTCKAMLMDGEVEMDVVYGLEPDEIEDGYILTCQAHPRSETILVDYDI